MVNLYRLITALLLSFVCLNSFALIQPQSEQLWYNSSYKGYMQHLPTLGLTSYDRCVTDFSGRNSIYHGTRVISSSFVDGKTTLNVQGYTLKTGDIVINYTCTQGGPYTCPANSYLTDGGCACNTGYLENGNSCEVKPHDPCEGLENYCAAKQNNGFDWQAKGKSNGRQWTCQSAQSWVSGIGDGFTGYVDDFPGCNKGCMGSTSGFDLSQQADDGSWVTVGSGKYTGSICDPSVIADLNGEKGDEETPPEIDKNADKTCPNGFKGTVNGVSVCVPPKASSGLSGFETTDNGDGTTTESKTQVQCENGICSVTKTTTTKNNETSEIVSDSSTTTTVDKSSYCSQNKTAGVCKNESGEAQGGGEFGGSCSAGFTCDGDAIQCAIAKEQHIRGCQMNEDLLKTDEYKAWQAAKAWDGKSVTNDLPGNREFHISVKSGDEFIGSGSCPSDKTIDLPFGYSLTIPFSEMCSWLAILGEGMVILAYIGGALIIIRRQS